MSLTKPKIFLVEDDFMFSTMMKDHLEESGKFDITVFPTGEECLKKIYDNPAYVILDYNLNSHDANAQNGIQILESIHKLDQNIFVIMLSSQESYGVAAKSIMKGAGSYIIKDNDAFQQIDALLAD